MNIPIYRGLKLGTENEYVIGFFHSRKWDGETRTEYYITYESLEWEIDPTTLAIHFEDMIDIKGDKIFASLQEYGKGGDILQSRGYKAPCVFNKGFTVKTVVGVCNFYMLADRLKVVGIQE